MNKEELSSYRMLEVGLASRLEEVPKTTDNLALPYILFWNNKSDDLPVRVVFREYAGYGIDGVVVKGIRDSNDRRPNRFTTGNNFLGIVDPEGLLFGSLYCCMAGGSNNCDLLGRGWYGAWAEHNSIDSEGM